MQSLTNVVERVGNPAQMKSEQQPSTRTFSRDEQNLVGWFFASLRTQWGAAKYNSQFGEGDDVKFAKRHWADRILKYTRVELAEMLQMADAERMNGNTRFDWPDIAAVLSLTSTAWERQAHKEYRPERLLVDQGAKAKAREAGEHFFQEMRELFK